jgi:Tol biopolymer transport system component
MTRLTTSGNTSLAAISQDGRYVVHVTDEGGRQSLWIRQVATSSNVQIVPAGEVRFQGITFTPDGNFVDYVAYPRAADFANVYQVPVLGGTSRKVLFDADSRVTYSPDGRRMAFLRFMPEENVSNLVVVGADGTGETVLASRPAAGRFAGGPAWSPDGRRIAILATESSGVPRARAVTVQVDGGRVENLGAKTWVRGGSVGWAADGRELFVTAFDPDASTGSQIWGLSYPDGTSRRITNDLNSYQGISLTADARSLATVQSDTRMGLAIVPDGKAAHLRQVTSEGPTFDGQQGLVWANDGRLIYVSLLKRMNIFAVPPDGGGAQQLTSEGPWFMPAVSPDGRTIAVVGTRGNSLRVWLMDAGGGNLRPLTPGPRDVLPIFTGDGRSVIYVAQEGEGKVQQISVEGGDPRPLALDPGAAVGPGGKPLVLRTAAAVSRDGRWLAGIYFDQQKLAQRIAIAYLSSKEPARTYDFVPNNTQFTPDGRGLSYIDTRGGASNIWIQPIDGSPARQVTDFRSDRIFAHSWSPDGKSLALSRGKVTNDVVLISNLDR